MLSLFAFFVVCSYGHAATPQLKKIYLDERSVMVKKGCIRIKSGNSSVRVKLLRSDKNGIYVFEKDLYSIVKGRHFFRKPEHTCDECTEMFPSHEDLKKHEKNECPCR